MLGGRVIGQGTYGCAVTPPLLCKGRARNERKENQGVKVGKLTLNTDAATEIQRFCERYHFGKTILFFLN